VQKASLAQNFLTSRFCHHKPHNLRAQLFSFFSNYDLPYLVVDLKKHVS